MQKDPLTMKQVIEEMEIYLNNTEMTYEVVQKNSERIYKRTTRIMRTVFISIGVLLAVNVYFIYDFGAGIISMVSNMNKMYTHFGNMAIQVHGIAGSVKKMTSHVEVLPKIAQSMDSMNHTVDNMNTNVHLMQSEVNLMANNVDGINNNMISMSDRFEKVNGNVHSIDKNAHQMSELMPKF